MLATPLLRRYSPYRISTVVGLAAIAPLAATPAPQLAHESWSTISTLAWLGLAYTILLARQRRPPISVID